MASKVESTLLVASTVDHRLIREANCTKITLAWPVEDLGMEEIQTHSKASAGGKNSITSLQYRFSIFFELLLFFFALKDGLLVAGRPQHVVAGIVSLAVHHACGNPLSLLTLSFTPAERNPRMAVLCSSAWEVPWVRIKETKVQNMLSQKTAVRERKGASTSPQKNRDIKPQGDSEIDSWFSSE